MLPIHSTKPVFTAPHPPRPQYPQRCLLLDTLHIEVFYTEILSLCVWSTGQCCSLVISFYTSVVCFQVNMSSEVRKGLFFILPIQKKMLLMKWNQREVMSRQNSSIDLTVVLRSSTPHSASVVLQISRVDVVDVYVLYMYWVSWVIFITISQGKCQLYTHTAYLPSLFYFITFLITIIIIMSSKIRFKSEMLYYHINLKFPFICS